MEFRGNFWAIGRYLLLSVVLLYHFVASAALVAQGPVDPINGSLLVDVKCSKCHTLKRVFIMPRPMEEWRDIVEEMMDKNPEWISPEEAQQILGEIVSTWPERVRAVTSERMDYEDARFLFIDRCTLCHSINRILLKDMPAEEWRETVEHMRSEAGDYITREDAERIARFLSERAEVLKEDAGAVILVAKCLICHPGERILLETHDRAGWEKIIQEMQRITLDTFHAVWFGPDEAELLVDLLVKTQGLKTGGSLP
ncbi:MAG: hypothetical protein ACE5IC_09065 [Candidatus Brocadiales bacterium]